MSIRGMALASVGLTSMAMVLTACASAQVHPTKEHPVMACVVSCPYGFAFREQHKCRSDKRWFRDVLLTGEYTSRAVDGTATVDVWTSAEGDFDKRDVIFGSCSAFKSRINMPEAEQRDPKRDRD